MKKITLLFLLLFSSLVQAQDTTYARSVIRNLTLPYYQGRGYFRNGDSKAARYVASEFHRWGLQTVNGFSYFQQFHFPVNTFPGSMDVVIGNKKLTPGKDFIVSPACPSVEGTFEIVKADLNGGYQQDKKKYLLIDKSAFPDSLKPQLDSLEKNPGDVGGVLVVEPKKLTWSVAGKVAAVPVIRLLKDSFPADASTIRLDISNSFDSDHISQNVVGYYKGAQYPDSFIVFTAHYDHLGRMGRKTLFPGANDNASGIAMLLNLMGYYSDPSRRPGCSLLFIAFGGEEAGLLGSKYYTEHPRLPLNEIRFLINMDLMGTGEDGMMVVNGEIYDHAFNLLQQINDEEKLLKTIGKRGKARNSDHYYFSEKGVPSFFFYTTGGPTAYHDIYDVAGNLPLTAFGNVVKLITQFVKRY